MDRRRAVQKEDRLRMSTYPQDRRPAPLGFLIWPLILVFVVFGLLAWRFVPDLLHRATRSSGAAEPRAVKYREGLYENEKTTIELYKHARPSVVNVTSLTLRRDSRTRNLQR